MLNTIAWFSLGLAFICAIIVAIDEVRHPQKMWIMNVVWPVTCLYFSVFALWAYFSAGRGMIKEVMRTMSEEEMNQQQQKQKEQARRSPTWKQTALADSHRGAGCVLADIVTEFTVFGVGATLFGIELYASFLWDFLAAWALGIVFQYFTIKPMRDLSVSEGIWAAIKADTLSILTFQIGMYGWMALTFFKFFPHPHLHVNEPGLLVHDAVRHDLRVCYGPARESIPREDRLERGDGMSGAEGTLAISASNTDPILNELLEHRASFLAFLTARLSDPATAEDALRAEYIRILKKGANFRRRKAPREITCLDLFTGTLLIFQDAATTPVSK